MILTDELCDKLCAAEGGSLFAIQSNDPRITLVAGGYPLFHRGKIAGSFWHCSGPIPTVLLNFF